MTRRGAVAGIVSTAMAQSVARLIGKVTPTQAEYEAREKERSKKVAAMAPGAPWSYIGCEPPRSGPPYVCEIDAEVLTGIRVVSGKETIEVTMAEIMAALRGPRDLDLAEEWKKTALLWQENYYSCVGKK